MNFQSLSRKLRAFRSLPAVVLGCLLGGAPTAAFAVDQFVFGQVFQIGSAAAADTSIPDSGLGGKPYPYVHVAVYNRNTGALLGQGDAGGNGQFTVVFPRPAVPSLDIECRVTKVVDGGSQSLPAARPAFNSFSGISQFQGVALRVASNEVFDYAPPLHGGHPGVGLLFTRVGNVEIPFISQDTTLAVRPMTGLAHVAPATPADIQHVADVGVPLFKRAPFSDRLLIFGDFGLPGSACAGQHIDYYQVKIRKIIEGSNPLAYESPDLLLQDPLSKIRTQVITSPSVSVHNTTVRIGPFVGSHAGSDVPGLYWVNENEVGGVANTFYSFPDLRVSWVSNAANGLYEISVVYYRQTGLLGTTPIVNEIPAGCFVSGDALPPAEAASVALNKLIVRVDNHPLTARFDHIYLKDIATGLYFTGGGPAPLDFNDRGLCDIMHLAKHYQVEIRFTARQEGGYMESYTLAATRNGATVPDVTFDQDSFTPHVTATNPLWEGTPLAGKTVVSPGGSFATPCAYIFTLGAQSRLQNGYQYIQSAAPQRAYYVTPGS